MKLSTNSEFLARLQYNLVMAARVILSETGVGATHTARAFYARQVVQSPNQAAANAAPMVVGGTNVIGTVTDNGDGSVTTSVTDGALFSQVNAFWNALAGIDTGN
jgi:hypothetical protein